MKKLLFLFALIFFSCDLIGWTSKQEVDFFETCEGLVESSAGIREKDVIYEVCNCAIGIAKSNYKNGIDGRESLYKNNLNLARNLDYRNCFEKYAWN